MTDKFYLLQTRKPAKQAGVKELQFKLALALPTSEAPKGLLKPEKLPCPLVQHNGCEHASHSQSILTYNSAFQWLRGHRRSTRRDGRSAARHRDSSYAALTCGSTTQPCRGMHSTTAATSQKQEIRFRTGLKNILGREDAANNESFLYIKDNIQIGLFFPQ